MNIFHEEYMNLKPKLLILLLVLSAGVPSFPPAQAQESVPRRLSLEDAVRLAMKQNPDLITARLEVKRSDARVLEAWGNAMPSVDVSGQFVHMPNKPVSFFPDYFLYSFMKAIDSTYPKPSGQLVPDFLRPCVQRECVPQCDTGSFQWSCFCRCRRSSGLFAPRGTSTRESKSKLSPRLARLIMERFFRGSLRFDAFKPPKR